MSQRLVVITLSPPDRGLLWIEKTRARGRWISPNGLEPNLLPFSSALKTPAQAGHHLMVRVTSEFR